MKSTELHALVNRPQVNVHSAVRGVKLLSCTLDIIISVDKVDI